MLSKIEKLIFHLFIFCLPFQTRIILKTWGGSFNEWQAVFLYGTDLLIFTLFTFWAIRVLTVQGRSGYIELSSIGTPTSPSQLTLPIFLVITALSLTQADNKILGLYRLTKILEFVGLYYYIRSSLGKVFSWASSFLAVVWSGFFQTVIAVGQSLFQHSLGLKWLGESVLRVNFNAVAVVPTAAGKLLRAYGTTPHPNVLAAWLFLGIFAFYFWYLYAERRLWPVFTVYPFLLWGLFSTFSRVAVGLWLAGVVLRLLVVYWKRKKYDFGQIFKKRLLLLSAVSLAMVFVFSFFYWPQVHSRIFISSQEQAVSQRILYAKMAGEIASHKPWLGVGVGQFVGTLQSSFKNYPDYFYQPVHNIYLLILDEVGFFGLAAFVVWLATLIYEYYRLTRFKELYHVSFFMVFVSILIMGLFDHFLWSLQQGQLMFWLALGLIASSDSFKNIVLLEN